MCLNEDGWTSPTRKRTEKVVCCLLCWPCIIRRQVNQTYSQLASCKSELPSYMIWWSEGNPMRIVPTVVSFANNQSHGHAIIWISWLLSGWLGLQRSHWESTAGDSRCQHLLLNRAPPEPGATVSFADPLPIRTLDSGWDQVKA
jgi:hypothetical protein